jgi:hypothetical protein
MDLSCQDISRLKRPVRYLGPSIQHFLIEHLFCSGQNHGLAFHGFSSRYEGSSAKRAWFQQILVTMGSS